MVVWVAELDVLIADPGMALSFVVPVRMAVL